MWCLRLSVVVEALFVEDVGVVLLQDSVAEVLLPIVIVDGGVLPGVVSEVEDEGHSPHPWLRRVLFILLTVI